MTTELELTAYHEAGHAVIMILYGIRFERVTIAADEDALGHVLRANAPWFNPDWDTSPFAQHYIRARITGSLAGPLAEKELSGEFNTVGASSDHAHAADLALYATSSPEDSSALLARLEQDAEEDVGAFWWHIDAVAKALLAKQSLSEAEVGEIMSHVPDNPNPFGGV